MRLSPIILFLAATSVFAANQVKLVQLGYKEACEENGNGRYVMAVDVGDISPADKFQSYEIAVSYKDQPVSISMPALFVNTLTAQIPEQYRAFSNDGENELFYGSAALITTSENGVSGTSLLIGFSVIDDSECDETAELEITQFFVNPDCKIDFEVDSTYQIEKRYSEKFISELTASSQISSLTLDKDTTSGNMSIDYQIINARKADYAELVIMKDDSLELSINITAQVDSSIISGDTIKLWGLASSGGELVNIDYSYIGEKGNDDTLAIAWDMQIMQECDCIVAEDLGDNYSIIYQAQTNGSVVYSLSNEKVFSYKEALVSDSYQGRLFIVSVHGKTETIDSFRSGMHALTNGVYMLIKENNEIEKLIVNSF